VLISIRIIHVCDDFVLVIVLLLVIDRSAYEHDYDKSTKGPSVAAAAVCCVRAKLATVPEKIAFIMDGGSQRASAQIDPMRTPFFSFRRVLLWSAVLTAVSGNGAASEWPKWRGPNGDGHAPPGVALPATLPKEARYIWKVKVGDSLGSPVVSGGRVLPRRQRGRERTGSLLGKRDLDHAAR
jgi:hypothetical protein